jgi:anti-sigma B factor antagonist
MQAMSLDTDPDGTLEVVLRGEIDFTNSPEIGETIHVTVERDRPTVVRVNLAQVTFLDSSGIGVLVAAMRAAEDIGAAYQVREPAPKILDQLRTVGLAEVFGLEEPGAAAG